MNEDQLLAATHGRMMAALDEFFPVNEEAPSALTPEASVLKPNHPAREDKAERDEYYRRP